MKALPSWQRWLMKPTSAAVAAFTIVTATVVGVMVASQASLAELVVTEIFALCCGAFGFGAGAWWAWRSGD